MVQRRKSASTLYRVERELGAPAEHLRFTEPGRRGKDFERELDSERG